MSDGAGVEARLCCKLNDLVIRSVFQRRDGKKVGETGQTVGMVVSTESRNREYGLTWLANEGDTIQNHRDPTKTNSIRKLLSMHRADRLAYKTERNVRKVQTKGETVGYT